MVGRENDAMIAGLPDYMQDFARISAAAEG
jgi:hypothetical protein